MLEASTIYPLTISKIGQVVKLKSTSSVHNHLSKLEFEGELAIEINMPRAIRVIE